MVQLSHLYTTTGETIALIGWTFVGKMVSLLFNTLSSFVIAFLPRSKCLLISCLPSRNSLGRKQIFHGTLEVEVQMQTLKKERIYLFHSYILFKISNPFQKVIRLDPCRSWKKAKRSLEWVGRSKQGCETEDGLKIWTHFQFCLSHYLRQTAHWFRVLLSVFVLK